MRARVSTSSPCSAPPFGPAKRSIDRTQTQKQQQILLLLLLGQTPATTHEERREHMSHVHGIQQTEKSTHQTKSRAVQPWMSHECTTDRDYVRFAGKIQILYNTQPPPSTPFHTQHHAKFPVVWCQASGYPQTKAKNHPTARRICV